MWVGSLSGSGSGNPNSWRAVVEVSIQDDEGSRVKFADVGGLWDAGGADSGRTKGNGRVTFTLSGLTADSVQFVVTSVSHPDYAYDPSGNAATSVVIARPD